MEGTTRSAAVLFFLLISQGKSYCIYMMDYYYYYCKEKKQFVCHNFKMMYTKTHYGVKNFLGYLSSMSLVLDCIRWKYGILATLWLHMSGNLICIIITANNDDILLVSDCCVMPLWVLKKNCIFCFNTVDCNTIICYLYLISIFLSLVTAKFIWHMQTCIHFLHLNVRSCIQTHDFNNEFICQNVEDLFSFSSCI